MMSLRAKPQQVQLSDEEKARREGYARKSEEDRLAWEARCAKVDAMTPEEREDFLKAEQEKNIRERAENTQKYGDWINH